MRRQWLIYAVVYSFFLATFAFGEVRLITRPDFAVCSASDNTTVTSSGGHTGRCVSNAAVNPPYVDVRDFGAVCDNTTDDAAAINAAIAAVTTGGEVKLPGLGAKCLIKSPINASKPITLSGQGRSHIADTWDAPTTIVPSADFVGDNAINVTGNHVRLEGFTVHGVAGNGAVGIHATGPGFIMRDISVFRMDNNGIRIGSDSAGSNSNYWHAEHVKATYNVGDGWYIHSADINANAGTCVGCEGSVNGGAGLKIGTAAANAFYGFTAEQNTGYGVHLYKPTATAGAFKNTFYGGDIDEANNGGAIDLYIDSGSNYNKFIYISVQTNKITDSGLNNRILYPTWGYFKGALVYNSVGDLSLTDNTSTILQWDTSVYAEDNSALPYGGTGYDDYIWKPATDNTKLFVPNGARWVRMYAQVQFSTTDNTGYHQIEMFKQGTTLGHCKVNKVPTDAITEDLISCITPPLSVTAGEYFQLKAFSNNGAAFNVIGATYFGMEVIQ